MADPVAGPAASPGPNRGRRPRLDKSTADIRTAVADSLAEGPADGSVLVAVSGGADSMALAAAVAFLAPRRGFTARAAIVDHGLQPDSATVAALVAGRVEAIGLPTTVLRVRVEQSPAGLEAAARNARYGALRDHARRRGAEQILLGHTLDDQAETVLLGIARGSGTRALAGMAARRDGLVRPLLGLRRADTVASCRAQRIDVWSDPMNADPAFARVRARLRALPVLEEALGPGIAEALARTASLARDDADALDAIAEAADQEAPASSAVGRVYALEIQPRAVRTRIIGDRIRRITGKAGDVRAEHVWAVDDLVTGRRSGRVSLPGDFYAVREDDRILLARLASPGARRS